MKKTGNDWFTTTDDEINRSFRRICVIVFIAIVCILLSFHLVNASVGSKEQNFLQSLASAPLSATTGFATTDIGFLASVSLHFSVPPTSAETIRVYRKSRAGSSFDTLLGKYVTSPGNTSDVLFTFGNQPPITESDQVRVTCTNVSGAGSVTASVLLDATARTGVTGTIRDNGVEITNISDSPCVDNDTTQCLLSGTRTADDADFVATNIKNGINILNVTGTLVAAYPTCVNDDTILCSLPALRNTADANFVAANIRTGTNILNVTGTLVEADAACANDSSVQCTLPVARNANDTDFVAGNVKSGVNVLNVTGTYAPACADDGTNQCALDTTRSTSDPDFVAANIATGINVMGVTGALAPGAAACVGDDTTACTLNATRSTSDADFVAGNIATGVNILNVTGSHAGAAAVCTNDASTQCTLSATRSTDDAQFTAGNVKSGINILNVTGTYAAACSNDASTECALNTTRSTSDADFTAANIANGVNILNVTGSAVVATGDITTNLTHWLKLDDTSGTSATDSSGNSHTGTLVNGSVWSPQDGLVDGGLLLDGTNDYLAIASPSLPTADFTYAMAFQIGLPLVSANLFHAYSASGGTSELYVFVDTTGYVNVTLHGLALFINGPRLDTGKYNHIVLTRTGGVVTLYINGAISRVAQYSTALSFSTCYLIVGALSASTCATSAAGQYLSGFIDDLRIYSRGLSATDVVRLYNTVQTGGGHTPDLTTGLISYLALDETSGTAASDSSGASHPGVLVNGAAFTTSGCKVGAACVTLDGTNDHVTVANPGFSTGDWSVAGWFNFGTNSAQRSTFCLKQSSITHTYQVCSERTNTNYFDSFVAGSFLITTIDSSILANEWTHIALTRRAGLVRVYIQGKPVYGRTSATALTLTTCEFIWGAYSGSGCTASAGYMNGKLDDLYLFTRALSDTDVAALAAM